MHAEKLLELRAFLTKPGFEHIRPRVPLGHEDADSYLKGGLERGVLHEVYSAIGHEAAATGFTAGLAMRVAENKHLLWIAQDFAATEFGALSATGLLELGFDPDHLLMLCVANVGDGLRAASDALACQALGAVVIEISGRPKALDMTTSRRLTLAAAEKAVTVFLLRFCTQPGISTAETRWLVRGASSSGQDKNWGRPVFGAHLIRNRHGQTGEWIMEWNGDERTFKAPKAA